MTVQTAIQTIADKLADAERRTSQTLKDFRGLRDEFKEIGDETQGAGLIASAYAAELEFIAARQKSELLDLHVRLENDRKILGLPDANVPLAGDGEVTIFSGGR